MGYLLKDEAPHVIVAAVRAAARGEGWFSAKVAAQVAAWARGAPVRLHALTEREAEELRVLAKGQSNKEIAKRLKVTERTVEFHISNLKQKLQVSSRVELAVWAKAHGLEAR